MNEEIAQLQRELGISRGTLVALAREVTHDSTIRSIERMPAEYERMVIGALKMARARSILSMYQVELETVCA